MQRALAGDESRRVNDIGIERGFFCRVRINVRALASASPDRSTGRTAPLDGPTFERAMMTIRDSCSYMKRLYKATFN